MATLVDSYSESNQSAEISQYDDRYYVGQSFTGNGGVLESAKFYIRKAGTPIGNINVVVYAETHATAFGTDSAGTGSVLATSNSVDSTTLGTSLALVSFTFTGENQITLTDGTYYVIMVGGNTGADINNCVKVGYDNSSPTHAGNIVTKDIYGWAVGDSYDTCFYVYAEPPEPPETPVVGEKYALPPFRRA